MGKRIGLDLLFDVDDDFKEEGNLLTWAQCAVDAFALPPGVKRVEVLTPEPPEDDVTGENYR